MRFSDDDGHLYDVVAVSLDNNRILWVERKKTLPNAEAVVAMAVMRQGCDDRFFSEVPHGAYQEGDKWQGKNKHGAK